MLLGVVTTCHVKKKTLPNIENKKVYKQKSQSYIEDQIISYNLNNRAYSPILKLYLINISEPTRPY